MSFLSLSNTAVAGPRAWNNLPDFITDSSSSRTFKQYLNTYLFSVHVILSTKQPPYLMTV